MQILGNVDKPLMSQKEVFDNLQVNAFEVY